MSRSAWDLSGLRMAGRYLGQFSYSGVVEWSRVRRDGSIEHYVALDRAIEVYDNCRDHVLVLDWEIDSVTVNYEAMA